MVCGYRSANGLSSFTGAMEGGLDGKERGSSPNGMPDGVCDLFRDVEFTGADPLAIYVYPSLFAADLTALRLPPTHTRTSLP